jgi:predicted transcriptional regulator
MREILKTLQREQDLSVKAISKKINSQWETTIKALDFLKEVGLVKEKRGNQSYKSERLFSLTKASS